MARIAPALALFFALVAPTLAGDWTTCKIPGIPRIEGMDYHHARAALIVAGFRPVAVKPDASIDGDLVKPARALGYIETADCGNAACLFTWRPPKGRAFSVVVAGEWAFHGLHDGVRVIACQF